MFTNASMPFDAEVSMLAGAMIVGVKKYGTYVIGCGRRMVVVGFDELEDVYLIDKRSFSETTFTTTAAPSAHSHEELCSALDWLVSSDS